MLKRKPDTLITYVNIMVQKLRKFDKYELRAVPKSRLKRWDKVAKPYIGKLSNIKVTTPYGERRYMEVDKVNTFSKLAEEVRKAYGYGTFNLLFFSQTAHNKNHKKNFKCVGKDCKWYKSCRLKNREFKHLSCKANSKYKAQWQKRCKLIIIPVSDRYSDIDYRFNVANNKMHLVRWFKK